MNDLQNTNQDTDSRPKAATQNDFLNELLGKIMSSSASQTASPSADSQRKGNDDIQDSSAKSAPAGASPSPDILSSLLSNPDLLTKLPTIISAIKPVMDILSSTAQAKDSVAVSSQMSDPSTAQPTSPTINLQHDDRHKKEADCRAALLCAMKPYLGRDRQNAIDYIIKLSRLGDLLKTL